MFCRATAPSRFVSALLSLSPATGNRASSNVVISGDQARAQLPSAAQRRYHAACVHQPHTTADHLSSDVLLSEMLQAQQTLTGVSESALSTRFTSPIPNPSDPLALELHADWLRAPLGDGIYGDFHHRWLRHNCDCDRHPKTGERTLCSSELPDDVQPRSVILDGDALEVEWSPDGHKSRYPLDWLRANAYAINRKAPPPPQADLTDITIEARGMTLAEQVREAMSRVYSYGAAVVRRDPTHKHPAEEDTEAIISAFEAGGLDIVPSHFGRLEDLRTDNTTNKNTDQLGYTNAAIDLHTDQPFIRKPPRFQMLHGIRQADIGGVNLLADAKAVFQYLESVDANAAELLATVPVRFHRKQKDFESAVVTPLVVQDGNKFNVRSSYFTLAPHALPFAQMTSFYRAHDRFIRLLRDPRHQYRALLTAGDWLIYDNHRTLHARTGFSGARWLRGIYFDPVVDHDNKKQ